MASSVQEEQAITKGSFKNVTNVKMELMEIKRYSGFFQDGGPNAILEHYENTAFIHNGEPPNGSKVGVAYRGYNDGQWVFAWHVPQPNMLTVIQPNKVLGKFFLAGEEIDWVNIEKELDESNSNEISDPYFRATITPHGSKAQLDVNFLNVPH
ncbi:unnamed protein product [Amaranthus hypochondriacus]